jgi:hypothetical protein
MYTFRLSTYSQVFCKWGVMDDARLKRLEQLDTCRYCVCVTPVISTTHRRQPAMPSTLQGTDDMVVLHYVTERDTDLLA